MKEATRRREKTTISQELKEKQEETIGVYRHRGWEVFFLSSFSFLYRMTINMTRRDAKEIFSLEKKEFKENFLLPLLQVNVEVPKDM